jgi:hypothetical protein|tara:strand:+ start:1425 stop:2180 length:756 start_codon:yes stop_codon:yes gene_type:complete
MKKIILLLSIFSLSSCSLLYNTSKDNNESSRKFTPKKSIRIANNNLNSIEYIQAKAKVSFRDNNKIKSNTITMRISSDEKIWINASLGAARILIDNDSVKYYNKIEKNYFVSDINYINEKIGFESNFEILQNLLLGILIHKFDPSSLYQKTENSYVYKDDKFNLNSKVIQSTVSISPFNSRVLKHSFKDQNNFFEVSYDDYTIVDEQILPTKIRFSNNGLESLYIEIKSISSLEKINIPFRIPKNYKRIKL